MGHLFKAAALSLAVLSVTSCAAVSTSASAAEVTEEESAVSYNKGDLNRDGYINSADALKILQSSINTAVLSSDDFWIADYNDDGAVDSLDAVLTLHAGTVVEVVSVPVAPAETKTLVSEFEGWSAADIVEKVGPIFTEDQRKTGILASVSMAQFILESGYGQSRLSIEANNCFGVKGFIGEGGGPGLPWDGYTVYTASTLEYDYYGNPYYTTASFRWYDSLEDSIEDHSNILINSSWDGVHYLYEGIDTCTDYRKACQILYNGGYATDPGYVDYLCLLIDQWDLTRFDLANAPAPQTQVVTRSSHPENTLYRVRYKWDDSSTQMGAFSYLENAVECADLYPGCIVFDSNGTVIYTS